MSQRRRGFTLIDAVVGIAIAAVLAAALFVTIEGSSVGSASADSAQRASAAALVLYDIVTSIASLETTNPPVSFHQTVGAYPHALSQLTTPITTTDLNSCNRAGTDNYLTGTVPATPINPGYVNGWNGPYYSLAFVAGATTQLASGFVVQDVMVRVPANPVNNPKGAEWEGVLQIVMPSVTQSDAQALDAAVDQTISGTSGTVRYTASDPTVLNYEIQVSRC